jgi:hypothetical protein
MTLRLEGYVELPPYAGPGGFDAVAWLVAITFVANVVVI